MPYLNFQIHNIPCKKLLFILLLILFNPSLIYAQGLPLSQALSCKEFLVARISIAGNTIGQEDCQMKETVVTDNTWPEITQVLDVTADRKYRRIEIGLTGSLYGFAVKSGPRIVTFTSAPEFVFVQSGNKTEPLSGILRYDMQRGASMSLIFPEEGAWNGKLFVTLPGMGSYRAGTSKTWDMNYDIEDPMGDVEKHHKLMLLKGYAVAITRRNHLNRQPGDGDYTVQLMDGTVLMDRNPVDTPELIIGYAQVAQNVLENKLGESPSQTYWYGHSGGGRLGKLVNYNHYRTQANTGTDGEPIIDGIIVDDSGAGLYLPVIYRDGRDILFATEADKEPFVPMLEIAHQLYLNDRNDPVPEWVSSNFLINKYKNAKMLMDKGLANKFRFYEVKGISHDGGEDIPYQKRGDINIIPMWHLMNGFIDMLDSWVEAGKPPTPNRSDWIDIGDADSDGINENSGIALPEIACPLGFYYPFPPSNGRVGYTAFAEYDGINEEPLDGRAVKVGDDKYPHIAVATFADMNLNGYRDLRETVTQAWRRLELLNHDESFNHDEYISCVTNSVNELVVQGFLTSSIGDYYVRKARIDPPPEWAR